MNSTTLKHHKLITLLAELACVCLLFAAIVSCIPREIHVSAPHSLSDSLTVSPNPEGSSHLTYEGAEIVTDENGRYAITYIPIEGGATIEGDGNANGGYMISGSILDKIDPSGDSADGSYNVSHFYGESVNGSADISHAQVHKPSHQDSTWTVAPSPLGVMDSLLPLLACILLLLYAIKWHQHPKASVILGLVFLLSVLAALVIHRSTVSVQLAMGLSVAEALLFVLLAVLAFANKLNPKVALVAAIPILVGELLITCGGNGLNSYDILGTVTNLIHAVGFICFVAAGILCTVKGQAAPSETETAAADTAP